MPYGSTESIDPLIDGLFEADLPILPVGLMEELIAAGEAAVGPLIEVVREAAEEGAEMASAWAAIVLGQLRSPAAPEVLAEAIRSLPSGELTYPVAAAEALAEIGPAALQAVRSLAAAERESDRLWAYYAAGRMRDPSAVAFLLAALERDEAMIDVIALALADAGDAAAIAPLERAAERAEAWQRADLAEAIDDLGRGTPESPASEDWRLRYRLNEFLAPFPVAWPVIMAAVLDVRRQRPSPDDTPESSEEDDSAAGSVCEECGEPPWTATGVPVCACTAVTVPALQASMLDERAEALGSDDPFDALDSVEIELLEAADRPAPRSKRARERHEDDVTRLHFERAAIRWAVELGAESIPDACNLLVHHAELAAAEHGDPAGVFLPDPPPAAASPPAAAPPPGRNDPCPCGSGRKYKKCCGAPGAAAPRGPAATSVQGAPPGLPRLVTFDDEPVVFARAYYDVTDRDAVARALDDCAEVESTEPGQYVWFRTLTADERRPLGTIVLERPGRLSLECMSSERLARGRALLESIAAPWIRHRIDSAQDPWQAVAHAPAPHRRPPAAVPSEAEGAVLRQVMDRHYRTWPDDPLPALDGRTAREAVRTTDGRRRVADLLRSFEEAELGRPAEVRYDFGWIWDELGLER